MATYTEIYNLSSDTAFRNKIAIAVIIKANTISELATPTTRQLEWAKEAYEKPIRCAEIIQNAVLAANNTATVTQIQDATDASIQTNVNDAVDNIFTKNGV